MVVKVKRRGEGVAKVLYILVFNESVVICIINTKALFRHLTRPRRAPVALSAFHVFPRGAFGSLALEQILAIHRHRVSLPIPTLSNDCSPLPRPYPCLGASRGRGEWRPTAGPAREKRPGVVPHFHSFLIHEKALRDP